MTTAMAALDNPLFVLTKQPLTVFSKLLFEEKITLPEFESICNRLLLSPVHILTRILEPPHQVEGDRQSVAHLGLSDRWKAFLDTALSEQGERTHVCTSAATFCRVCFLSSSTSMVGLVLKTSIWQVER